MNVLPITRSVPALAALLLAGCAQVPVTPPALPAATVQPAPAFAYTHGASASRTPLYFRCVSEAALPMARAPASPKAIAGFAAARCDAQRRALVQALEEENAGLPQSAAYARIFGETLQARVVQHVAVQVREARRASDQLQRNARD